MITYKRSSLVFAIILCLGAAAFAQNASSVLSAQAALVTEFDVNGLKVIVKRRPSSSSVAAGLFIRGGSRTLSAENAGLENLMLQSISEASQKFPREAFRRELASTGASISGSGGYDYSTFAVVSTKQYFDRGWALFADAALHPTFLPADIEPVRQRLVSSLKDDQDSPDSYLQVLLNKSIYAGTSYANDPRGTVENLTRYTPEDLRKYHASVMQTSRLLLVVVGDVDPDTIKQRVAGTFGTLPRGSYKDPGIPKFNFSAATLEVTSRQLPTNYVEGVFAAPPPDDPDTYPMRVAVNVLRDRIFEEVRVKRNLSYAPNADMGSGAGNIGNIYVTAVDANQAVKVMLDEIRTLKTVPLDEREISGVAGQFLTTYFLGAETNAAQTGELARYELIGGGWRNSYVYLDKIRAVKAADVQRVAQKYMTNIRFVVLGDPRSVDRSVFLRTN